MDDDRQIDHDGLLKESSSSIMAGLGRTAVFLRRALPVVIALLVTVAVLIAAVLAVLIRQDAKSYQSVQLQADEVFAKYGAPPDHGQEWTCSEFVSNIQCWDGTYTYLYSPSGWTQLSGPEKEDENNNNNNRRMLFTHSGNYHLNVWRTNSNNAAVPVRWVWLSQRTYRSGYQYASSSLDITSFRYLGNSSFPPVDIKNPDGDPLTTAYFPLGAEVIRMYGDIDITPIVSTTSDTFARPFIQLEGAYWDGWPVNIYRKICVATGTSVAMNATAPNIECNNVDLSVELSGEPKLTIGTSCSFSTSNICDYSNPDLTICCGGQRLWSSTFAPYLYVAMAYTG